MKSKILVLVVLIVLGGVAGCRACVSPEQAVNISELHDGVVRLMPYAYEGIKFEIMTQNTIASDASRSMTERDAASKKATELVGRLMETKLLPAVSAPIRDWAIAKVGTAAYAKAKLERDALVASGGHN